MSHPNFLAFIKRFEDPLFQDADKFLKKNRLKTLLGVNYALFNFLFFKKLNKENLMALLSKAGLGDVTAYPRNLLAAMENDAASLFMLMEECILNHVMKNGKIIIDDKEYDKVILTPLIMDFGSKTASYRDLHYNRTPVKKPVVEQTIDVLNGIKNYNEQSTNKLFEIYPFMGINPKNYELTEIEHMLDMYFSDYNGSHETLLSNMGVFDGDMHNVRSNTFAGIKVYPLMGFDPWPNDSKELEKVELIYSRCMEKNIPITSHCSDEGFSIVSQEESENFTTPAKWDKVLNKYNKLKLNLAHLGKQDNSVQWQKGVIELILKYDNVYSDISYRAITDDFYKNLKSVLENLKEPSHINKLKERLLFGSDFMINLLKIGSYCEFYNIFVSTSYFDSNEKNLFCSTNPEQFLFS